MASFGSVEAIGIRWCFCWIRGDWMREGKEDADEKHHTSADGKGEG